MIPRLIGLYVAVALVIAGCGYRLAGSGDTGPGRSLRIASVEDEGDEPLFGAKVAKALAREAVDRADTNLVDRESARVVLRVQVNSVTERGAAFTEGDVTKEYVVVARATATLTSAEGEPIWKGREILVDREYPAGTSVDETEDNKERALALLARDLAREVLRRASLAMEAAR